MKRIGGGGQGQLTHPESSHLAASPKDKRPQGTGLTNQANVLHAGWQSWSVAPFEKLPGPLTTHTPQHPVSPPTVCAHRPDSSAAALYFRVCDSAGEDSAVG